MKALLALIMLAALAGNHALAAERKLLKDVVIDEMTKDSQATAKGAGDRHLGLAWWVPIEFWGSILERDAATSAADKQAMLNVMAEVSLLAVVQADISEVGAFNYYTKQQVEDTMLITFTDALDVKRQLTPIKTLSPDLQVVLSVFKPILEAAMGNLGSNFHFYVLDDRTSKAGRLIDPYREGVIDVQLARKDGVSLSLQIETPLNALFVPRTCPNGKAAHISWKYCPWSGALLRD